MNDWFERTSRLTFLIVEDFWGFVFLGAHRLREGFGATCFFRVGAFKGALLQGGGIYAGESMCTRYCCSYHVPWP